MLSILRCHTRGVVLWPRGLKALSSHYRTGEQLPDAMIAAQIKSKATGGLSTLIGMLRLGLRDMEVYSAGTDVDLSTVYSKYNELLGVKGREEKWIDANFAM
ncbi:hypothetical protein GQ53DRAFT_766901 [Thozetella sp. PMI_491]|nr:hypothetical protein GQ53DRAFT_766901 [Thozetella sp. PMI_491]